MIYRCCDENRKTAVLNNPSSITATPKVNVGGSGYAVGDVLTIPQVGSSATAQVSVDSVTATGAVSAVSLVTNGTGYMTATAVPTTGGSGTGCTLDISGTPNGIDYLEVLDHDAIPLNSPRQRTLLVHCLRMLPSTITRQNVLITGGESIVNIGVDWVAVGAAPPVTLTNALEQAYFTSLPDAGSVLLVRTSVAGDFSPYVLRLVSDVSHATLSPFEVTDVLPGFDPQLSEVEFSFKVECGPEFDCAPPLPNCRSEVLAPPPINYLAKDYGSFRGIMLDRLSQLLPGWNATSEGDLGIALAELISYVADRLSYRQDAIATEAYLDTARSRISLRRHALLVDYHVSDGCNARTWVHVTVIGRPGDKIFLDRKRTRFYTYAPEMPQDLSVGSGNEQAALRSGTKIFEPMWDQILYPDHNQMSFYTWGEMNCCLPKGATEATLHGSYPKLNLGDVLIFQEMKGPKTGYEADADIRNRWAVRLTKVAVEDAANGSLIDPLLEDGTGSPIQSPAQKPTPVTEIQWSWEDALPFPVCISSTFVDSKGDTQVLTDVSVVFGNNVLADHGLTLSGADLGKVPEPSLFLPPDSNADHCDNTPRKALPVRFRPQVPDRPITQAVPFVAVPIGELGNPTTAAVVPLPNSGFVSLLNAEGFACLTLETTNSSGWPQSFGIAAQVNGGDPSKVDLTLVYDPAGGGGGVNQLVPVEKFGGLSFNPSDPNYVVTRINGISRLIEIPASYTPPGTAPASYPTLPTMLLNSAPIELKDLSSAVYLTVEPTDATTWPALFGMQAQPSANPTFFDLEVVYDPTSGGIGVLLPVTLESFTNLSLQLASKQINGHSNLITVESFASTAAATLSAFALMHPEFGQAVPVIKLSGVQQATTETWEPEQDLLEIGESDLVFVVEVETDGTATLRFGDDKNGRNPESGTHFLATYRIGNATGGNVGADTLTRFAVDLGISSSIRDCRNPLPAVGGTEPETNDQIRRRAPQAFLTQQRAVTMKDYADVAEQNPLVDKAVANLRWTGSWYTVFIAVEPQGGGNLTSPLERAIKKNVGRYHLAGQDLELDNPQYVPLEIELEVCVDPDYFQSEVERALKDELGSGTLPSGQKGLFYPDNFTFGQTVHLSPIYARARSVAGVRAVRAKIFQPQGTVATTRYIDAGEIEIGPLQIARMANDPSYPNHGKLSLVLEGGK